MPSSPAASIRRPQVRELPTSSTRSTSMAPRPGRSASPTSLIGGEGTASARKPREAGEPGEALPRLLLDVGVDLPARGARIELAEQLLQPLGHPALAQQPVIGALLRCEHEQGA